MNIRILVPRSYLVSWHTQYASTSDNEIFIEMEPMSSETHTEALELPYTKVMLYEKQFLSNAPLYRVMHYSELDYKVGLLVLLSTTSWMCTEGMQISLHTFLTLALNRGEWSASSSYHIYPWSPTAVLDTILKRTILLLITEVSVQSSQSPLWPRHQYFYRALITACKMQRVILVTLVALQLLTARNHQRSRALRNLLTLWQLSQPFLFWVLLWDTQPDDRLTAAIAVRLTTWCSVTFRRDSFSRHDYEEDKRLLTVPYHRLNMCIYVMCL